MAKNKSAGVNADSIDLFTTLVKCPLPIVNPGLQFIFDLMYQNKFPHPIKRYFTNVYLFCLHKDPTDSTKLCPLGIPTTIRWLIARNVARSLRIKFSTHLLPYNYAVGVPNGSDFVIKAMQLSIELLLIILNNPTNHQHVLQSFWLNKLVQQCLLWGILWRHCHILSQTSPPHSTFLQKRRYCSPLMGQWIMAHTSHEGRHQPGMPTLTTLCIIRCNLPSWTHQLTPPLTSLRTSCTSLAMLTTFPHAFTSTTYHSSLHHSTQLALLLAAL